MNKKHLNSSGQLNLMLRTAGFPDSSTLIKLPSLKAPAPHKFPTFSELAGASASDKPVPKKETGLFEGLLGGDPRIIFQDLVTCPHKYQPGVDVLLQELISGQRKLKDLNPDEITELDHATLEYAQPTRAPLEEPSSPLTQREDPADYLPELMDEADEEPTTRGPMNAYWWLQ